MTFNNVNTHPCNNPGGLITSPKSTNNSHLTFSNSYGDGLDHQAAINGQELYHMNSLNNSSGPHMNSSQQDVSRAPHSPNSNILNASQSHHSMGIPGYTSVNVNNSMPHASESNSASHNSLSTNADLSNNSCPSIMNSLNTSGSMTNLVGNCGIQYANQGNNHNFPAYSSSSFSRARPASKANASNTFRVENSADFLATPRSSQHWPTLDSPCANSPVFRGRPDYVDVHGEVQRSNMGSFSSQSSTAMNSPMVSRIASLPIREGAKSTSMTQLHLHHHPLSSEKFPSFSSSCSPSTAALFQGLNGVPYTLSAVPNHVMQNSGLISHNSTSVVMVREGGANIPNSNNANFVNIGMDGNNASAFNYTNQHYNNSRPSLDNHFPAAATVGMAQYSNNAAQIPNTTLNYNPNSTNNNNSLYYNSLHNLRNVSIRLQRPDGSSSSENGIPSFRTHQSSALLYDPISELGENVNALVMGNAAEERSEDFSLDSGLSSVTRLES
eukprot:CAMPEP_0175043836 /NCGR_PEP_ID=MMETSP0052_2-20121109/3436_1 /TAXON_ID=51329 ORGANISM="Polytomella parva, Strain SAG 63-3" /NCGR_SAMPLE_ID=MMETSP0052_2 /ASSEMBLY_ACC=CAM_ASM_000194 /LENGTH=496 /DNA_ID=CAMNT_0016306995 /DNA_START=216 /DNA_END=1703 /DNA_ORIENTATION=-